jgi:ABC-type transport system involved in multi-copper enzyme maturation permease subunit
MSAPAIELSPAPQSRWLGVLILSGLAAASIPGFIMFGWWAGFALLGVVAFLGLFRLLRAPLTQFDMVRTARRGRFVLIRVLFAAVMLVVLYLVYASWFHVGPIEAMADLNTESAISPNDQARFAQSFYSTFLIAQYVVLMLLTPAFVAGALVEERERGTLQYLLTTCLDDGEIVAGKLLARTAFLLLILLAGIPILALLQLLGGVDPAYLAACLVLTFCNVVSVAACCLWLSTWTRRTRGGVGLGYLIMIAYHICFLLIGNTLATLGYGLTRGYLAAGMFQVGNFFGALGALQNIALDGSLGESLPWLLVVYLGFHVALTGLVLFLTRRRLRELTFPELPTVELALDDFEEHAHRNRPSLRTLPPILWKEMYTGRDVLARLAGWDLGSMGVYFGMFVVGALALASLAFLGGKDPTTMAFFQGFLVSVCVPLTVYIVMLWQALRAASTIGSERDQQTLDSLLTTQLSNQAILSGKWRACLGAVWKAALCVGAFLLLGQMLGGVNPIGVPLVLLAAAVQMVFIINLGMYCSVVCGTAARATAVTITSWLSITLGHWFLFLVGSVAATMAGNRGLIDLLAMFHAEGLTPPLTFSKLATLSGPPESIFAALVGTSIYLLAAAILWNRTQSRFARLAGRDE